MAVARFDAGKLDRTLRTGAGGARVPASIARTGVQTYHDSAGKPVREYRPADEVFSQRSLDSLASIPVTIGHPAKVDAKTWRKHAVGHVTDAAPARRTDGPVQWLDSHLVVSDADTLDGIERGDLTEVSMGYTADLDFTPGIAPSGEAYDAVQRNIQFNHLALLSDGQARAGRGARLRLDSNGDQMLVKRTDAGDTPQAKRIKVDGIDCDYGSETHVQMLDRRCEAAVTAQRTAEAALTAVQTEVGALKAKVDAIPAPPDVDALVAAELAFRDSISALLPKGYTFAGKDRNTVRLDAVGADAAARVSALPEAQREGYLTCLLDAKRTTADRPTHAPVVTKDDAVKPPTKFDPYAKFNAAYEGARK